MIKRMNRFVRFITFKGVTAISLAPFGIYILDAFLKDEVMINHEKIHWRQQLEMLIVFFYCWYLIEWLVRMFSKEPYRNISFEREAFHNARNPDYLKTRRKFAWIRYLARKV
jgi:hypothetical protein